MEMKEKFIFINFLNNIIFLICNNSNIYEYK